MVNQYPVTVFCVWSSQEGTELKGKWGEPEGKQKKRAEWAGRAISRLGAPGKPRKRLFFLEMEGALAWQQKREAMAAKNATKYPRRPN